MLTPQPYDIAILSAPDTDGVSHGHCAPSQSAAFHGAHPMQAFPDRGKIRKALGKLKFLVTKDPLDTETSRFWQDFGPQNPSDPTSRQTEVFQLPPTCFAEENGSIVSPARWLQWHWKAANAPAEARSDAWIMSGIFHRMREMYRKDGGICLA